MAEEAEEKTVYQEVEALGVLREEFEVFYGQLERADGLPAPGIVPLGSYKRIVDYLEKQGVVDANGLIQTDRFKLFRERVVLETALEGIEAREQEDRDTLRTSGGFTSCRNNDRLRGNGGFTSCRDD